MVFITNHLAEWHLSVTTYLHGIYPDIYVVCKRECGHMFSHRSTGEHCSAWHGVHFSHSGKQTWPSPGKVGRHLVAYLLVVKLHVRTNIFMNFRQHERILNKNTCSQLLPINSSVVKVKDTIAIMCLTKWFMLLSISIDYGRWDVCQMILVLDMYRDHPALILSVASPTS